MENADKLYILRKEIQQLTKNIYEIRVKKRNINYESIIKVYEQSEKKDSTIKVNFQII